MAYLPEYDSDVFVSYAHVDDIPLPGADTGWVTTFVHGLKTRLAQKLGRSDAYTLWMDHGLKGGERVSGQLLESVRRSATLIVVLSPGYVASPWCGRERDAFLDLIDERQARRVFVVEREEVEASERPLPLQDSKVFKFWVREREGKAPRILGTPRPDPADYEYYSMVDDLSQEIVAELRSMREERPAVAGAAVGVGTVAGLSEDEPAAFDGWRPSVFLAEVTDDLDLERNSVKRFLAQAGIRVVPETLYWQEPEVFRRAVAQDITGSDLFVQLLSALPGKKPEGLPQGYLACQADAAEEAQVPVLQWRSPTLDLATVKDPGHRALLEKPTVLAEGLEDFKRAIVTRLNERHQSEPSAPASTFVFVDMESSDRPLAEQICAMLDSYGAGYSLPSDSTDPGEYQKDLERNLTECDALIIVYGASTSTWVRRHLLESRKALALREPKRPLRALAVFEGPPEEKDGLNMKFGNMRIVDCRKGLCDAEVRRFLDSVSGAA